MPESLLVRRLKLGNFLGIDLFVHWTFGLVIAYVVFASSDTGTEGMAFAVTQLLGVFLCVTLHEYGHAMAARQFGISTADITLLPIGGVARLKRMPRIPWQELVVAVAGPAVNVAIGAALIAGFFALTDLTVLAATLRYFVASIMGLPLDEQTVATVNEVFTSPSFAGYAVTMLIINIMLVLFNMIPAFPMDGGRVFRSLLAMGIDYRKATRIASRVGLGCACLLAFCGAQCRSTAMATGADRRVRWICGHGRSATSRSDRIGSRFEGRRCDGAQHRSPANGHADQPSHRPLERLSVTSFSSRFCRWNRGRDAVPDGDSACAGHGNRSPDSCGTFDQS